MVSVESPLSQPPVDRAIRHVAIIMDGNRRWARKRFLPSLVGHQQGVTALEGIIRAACDQHLPVLTVYAFSTENWTRPLEEVNGLMQLFVIALRQQLKNLLAQRVRVRFIGDLATLPDKVQTVLAEVTEKTAAGDGLILQVATNYGSRAELTRAVRTLAVAVQSGQLEPDQIDEAAISQALYTGQVPDPDVLIRTGGESRLSNYLLWQCAYTELYISQTLWPDFNADEFSHILQTVSQRDRRFGR
jgi:undecaprenyl diphosphate synthase